MLLIGSAVSYYIVDDVSLSWNFAQEYCQQTCKSNLASFHAYVTLDLSDTTEYWIGLNKTDSSKTWEWIDGTDFDCDAITTPHRRLVFLHL